MTFTDLMIREAARVQTGAATGAGLEAGPLAATSRVGAGVAVANVTKLFELGDLKQTGSAFDVAIFGDGFLEVVMPDGSRAFSRGSTLKLNADGMLVTQSGHPLKPGITIPAVASGLTIVPDGRVLIGMPNRTEPVDAGQLEMVRFTNPSLLHAEGDNLYRATEASGEAIAGQPGREAAWARWPKARSRARTSSWSTRWSIS